LRAFDRQLFPVTLEPLDGGLAGTMAELHSRSFVSPWSAADLRRLVEAAHCHGIAARSGETLTGFIIISVAADEAEILTLAVDHAWQRRGIGGALIDAALAEAAGRGARVLLLEVGVSNAAAQSLYVSAGFTVAGRRRNYYKSPSGTEDALLMRREIAPPAS
jgi:ribosomal-protein-alanine N-acetyltransferase